MSDLDHEGASRSRLKQIVVLLIIDLNSTEVGSVGIADDVFGQMVFGYKHTLWNHF